MNKKILIIVGSVAIIMFAVIFFIINGKSSDNNSDYVSEKDNQQIIETSPLENIDSENDEGSKENVDDIIEQEALENVDEQDIVDNNVNYNNYAQYVQNIQKPSASNTGKTNTPSKEKPSTPSKGEINTPSKGETNTPSTEKPSTPSTPEVEEPVIPDTQKPSVTISKNSSNGVVKSVEVQITATDDREVDEIRYYVGKTEGNTYQIVKGNSVTISLDNNLQDGVYYIWYYAVDTSGNVSDVKKSGPYELDNTVTINQQIITNYANHVLLNDDGTISFEIGDYIIERNVVVKYSVVGVQEENTEFKEAVYYSDIWGDGFKTTDTYSEGEYKISLCLLDTLGNEAYVIDSKIMYLFN